MSKPHDALFESGHRGHDLERFLARAVFCLFADDAGIFERGIFLDFIETRKLPCVSEDATLYSSPERSKLCLSRPL